MVRVVSTIGKKNDCTLCGVFRRQALDRGAATLGVDHIVTGHNADDIAETVLMNSTLVPSPHGKPYIGWQSSEADIAQLGRWMYRDLHIGRRHDTVVQALPIRV